MLTCRVLRPPFLLWRNLSLLIFFLLILFAPLYLLSDSLSFSIVIQFPFIADVSYFLPLHISVCH